ncbi:conserved hypothetical protein [Microcystis aeruginosa PCC 9809]|uniref:Uncharacterized protein n=1 Tax=Microcystis aeruginosa PCC 9809 TaxID=1160285 RepID=I4HH47_MICAE|nr:conserved hypothetical protein [Microcystis aeruginosa PCC 9809]
MARLDLSVIFSYYITNSVISWPLAISKLSPGVADLRSERGLRERVTVNLDNEGRRRSAEGRRPFL